MALVPGSDAWQRKYYGLPCQQEMTVIDFCGHRIAVHKKAARHFKRLALIFKNKAPQYAKKIASSSDTGAYNCRKITGGSRMSLHAWATALDVRWNENGYGKETSPIEKEAMAAIRQAEKEGFRWGGRFSNPDNMHFETHLRPGQIKARYKRNGKRRAWYRDKS